MVGYKPDSESEIEAAQEASAPRHTHHGHAMSPEAHRYLFWRNVAVALAALLFGLSVLPFASRLHIDYPLKAIAYFTGAAAYAFEYFMLTDGLKHKPPRREMFMPNVFGLMYIILGISYIYH